MFDFVADTKRCALWADMGMGKTSVVLMVLAGLLLAGEADCVLIVAPLRVARDTWIEELRRWSQLQGLEMRLVLGDAEERSHALRGHKADIYVINYDNVPWLAERVGHDWPFDTLIFDEARRLKGARSVQGGVRTQALNRIAFSPRVRRIIELTGRPAPNGLTDLWGQIWYLDQGYRLGRTYTAFENRWFGFQRAQDAFNPSKTYTKRIVFPHAQAEIQDLLRGICLTVDPKDWFDVREPLVKTVEVTLPPDAARHYREMQRQMFTEIQDEQVEAFNAAAKTNKCLQLASGAAYFDDTGAWKEVHREKLEALESVVNEAGSPVLVAYQYKSSLARLKKAFPKAADLATPEGMALFKSGAVDLGFGHPASMGHGVDGLQEHCCTAAFFDQWWDLDQRDQFIGRIGPVRQMQSGKNRLVSIYNIVARGTVDEMVLQRLDSKRSVQEILLEAMKTERKAA